MSEATALGPYQIVAELGVGAVGRVVEAIDTRSGRSVAIKMLRGATRDTAAQRLLLDEAAVVVQLSHPHVVELIDVGRDDDSALFLVMELVRGTTLRAWGRQCPSPPTIFRVFGEMLEALSAAHAQGIVHGDLKPGNVLLAAGSHVKLTDFGIARVIDPLRRTEQGGMSGTPQYMAPEQVFDADDVGPTTDLYAMGVMLQQLLGRRQEIKPSTIVEMLERKRERLPAFTLRDGLDAPPELAALLDSLVCPDPRQRPRFAAHVRRELTLLANRVSEIGNTFTPGLEEGATHFDATVATSAPLPLPDSSVHDAPASTAEALLKRLRPVPLVARQSQIVELMSLARDAAEGGGPRALVIIGRAGEGKSRLARHGFAHVEREGIMVGAAASFDDTGTGANVDLRACVRRLIGAPRPGSTVDDTAATRWAWFAKGVSPGMLGQLHRWLLPNASPIDASDTASLAACAVSAASRVRPVYLWLDDIGWSRDGATELVSQLLESDARVVIVATMRSGTADHPTVGEWLAQVSAHPRAKAVHLPPMTRAERAELLRAVGPVAAEAAETLASLLDDPTLVIVESVREWIDEGLLVKMDLVDASEYVPRADVSYASLAARAKGALARKVDTLLASFGERSAAAERVLIHAALLGQHFDEKVLRRTCDASTLDLVLDRALLVGVLRVQGDGIYRFDHKLFAENLIERVHRAGDARTILMRTAEALLDVYGELRPEAMLRATHLFRAAGAHVRAYTVGYEAASSWARSSMFAEADDVIDLLERWARADETSEDGLSWGYVHRARSKLAYNALNYAGALESCQRARAIFARHGKTVIATSVASDEAKVLLYADRLRELSALLSSVTSDGDPHATTTIHHQRSQLSALRGDLDEAIADERRACAASPPKQNAAWSIVHGTLAVLLLLRGDTAEATDLIRLVTEVMATSTRADVSDFTVGLVVLSQVVRGQFAEALPGVDAWLGSTLSRDDRWHATSVRAFDALCKVAIASEETATRAVNEIIASYRQVPHDEPQTWWAIRATESLLRGRGLHALAETLGETLNARQRQIADAFERCASPPP